MFLRQADGAFHDVADLALDDLTRTRTWSELDERATRIARLLHDRLGLASDDHVALLMHNRVEYVEVVLGAICAGVWLTPVNRHLKDDELAFVLADCGAKVVFVDAEHEAIARRNCDASVLAVGEALDAELDAVSDEAMPSDGAAGGVMVYTSGTTGRPKGVKRARPASLGAALESFVASGGRLGLDGRGPHLVTGPLYHAAPLLFAVYDLVAGAPMLIMPRWDAEQALRLIDERAVVHTHMVPTMFVRLLRLVDGLADGLGAGRADGKGGRFAHDSLRLVLHGAAPIAPEVKERMIEWWGEVLVEYWGATEGGVCTLVDAADWLAHRGTVGHPIASFEVFAVDDAGQRLVPGEVGVLYCRHKSLAAVFEYHGDAAKTAASYLEPGVFTTGDVGYVDDDGYVYLSGRKSNMIISGGVNIYPAEIEQVLHQHEAVADVAVFGIPDEEWGETVKAAVELVDGRRPSVELEYEILEFARERLAAYKVPRSVDFERALPRHDTGKLYTRELRDRYWRESQRKI